MYSFLPENGAAAQRNSFAGRSREDIAGHVRQRWYGAFELTNAITPAYDLKVIPREGFRYDVEPARGECRLVHTITASATRKKVFGLFLGLLEGMSERVGAVLETVQPSTQDRWEQWHRSVERVVLQSALCGFEEFVTDDGCTSITAVEEPAKRMVVLDEHKLVVALACVRADLAPFEKVLHAHGIPNAPGMRFLPEEEHIHSSCDRYRSEFHRLCEELMPGDA
jgi:hypothetical protein